VVHVSGAQLSKLKIGIVFSLAAFDGGPASYSALVFQSTGTVSSNGMPPMNTYDLSWSTLAKESDLSAAMPGTPYCVDAQGKTDPVVFQQGIDVDPASGIVGDRRPDIVTMSCREGAMPTVYSWGYDYRTVVPADTFYFDAGIQMKRASYCGDAQYFTAAGTEIHIADDKGIQPWRPDPALIEAWWTPTGAQCVNPANERHRGMGFSGRCKDRKLPHCDFSPTGRYLVDAPKHPAQ
jgi:hypothetical protein